MNASDDGHPFDSDHLTAEEKMRNVARCVLRYTETGRNGNGAAPRRPDAQDTYALADAARHLAECVLA
jgi:hypothetical protein